MPNNNRWRNYGLWAAIAAFIPLLLSGLGIQIIPDGYEEIVNAFLGILVLAGIISNPTTSSKWFQDDTNKEELKDKK
ncbi:MAG: hypothetical protein ACLTBU_03545 [Zhenhengia sp.]|uniref:hypothetical protein n=1 Tax=Zhenhengia sp. TaxID=2944208 RepID=UPI003993B57E